MNEYNSKGLFTLQSLDSFCPPRNIYHLDSFEDEIKEEIEEEIIEEVQELPEEVEEEVMEEVMEFAEEVEEEKIEEDQEQRSVSSREYSSYTPFSNVSDKSERSAASQEALEEERKAKAALEKALKKERKEKSLQKEALNQERKANNALEKVLKKEKSEKASLRIEMECMTMQMADLKKTLKEHQRSNAKLKVKLTKMAAEHEEDKKVIEKLTNDLEVSSSQHQKEIAERDEVKCSQINAIQDRLIEQQKTSLEKDDDLQALHFDIQNLQGEIEAKDNIVSSLQKEVNQWASDLKEEQKKTCRLQREYEDADSKQKKGAEKLHCLTLENQHLASENTRLQSNLETALNERQVAINERQVARKRLQEARKACSGHEEAIREEKVLFQRAYNKLQMLDKELSEKTVHLEKSLTAEKCLRSSLKNEKRRFNQMFLQRQTEVNPVTVLSNQLREASASSEHLMYDMQTLRMENKDIRVKFNTMETQYDRLTSKYRSLSDRHDELMSKKNDNISENQAAIAELQSTVDELKARQSESKIRQAELEDALKEEKTRNAELQQRAGQTATALEKEKTTCEKHCVELKEALTKQIEVLVERQKLAVALQKGQDSYSRLQEQQQAEAAFQFRQLNNTELKLNQQNIALDESRKALQELQKDYTDLRRRHSDINSYYRELLNSHNSLKVRYERLSYAQGNPRPEFSPPQLTVTCLKSVAF